MDKRGKKTKYILISLEEEEEDSANELAWFVSSLRR